MRCILFVPLVLVAIFAPSPVTAQTVTVEVTNADDVVAALPDNNLSRDVLKALGESDLATTQFHRQGFHRDPGSLVTALIALAAPDAVTDVRSQGKSFTVSPVPDFASFIDAIDYGQVVDRSEADLVVKVAIDPDEVTTDALNARRDAHPSPPLIVRAMLGGGPGENPSTFGRGIRSSFDDERDNTDRLGGDFAVDDAVELDLGRKPYAAKVLEVESGAFGKVTLRIAIADTKTLQRAVRGRRLKTRLEKAEQVAFWVEASRLRKLDAMPIVLEERAWTDTSGKYRIVATYRGVESGKVRLEKSSGKSSLVPLAKLSEADREYVKQQLKRAEAGDNPFADRPEPRSRSLRADWNGIKPIRKRNFRRWEFNPAFDGAPEPARLAIESLDVTPPPETDGSFQKLEALHFAPDGGQVVVQMTADFGTDERQYLQLLDFQAGHSQELVVCPKGSKVLDVRVEDRLVLLHNNNTGRNNGRIYAYRLNDTDLSPINNWDALPPDSFHKNLEEARFVASDRVLTRGFAEDWIVWDRKQAKAIHRFDGDQVTLGPYDRFAFVRSRNELAAVDLVTGEHLASLPMPPLGLRHLTVNADLTRLALSGYNLAGFIDLTTGEPISAITGSLIQQGQLDFVGDLLLIDNEYLVEPYYPILLWQYRIATGGSGTTHATVRSNRLWYATRQKGTAINEDGAWTIASVKTPHTAIEKTLESVGDLEDLVILDEGDSVTVEVETDQGEKIAGQLRRVLSKALDESGFQVVEGSEADDETKQAVLVYKRAPEPVEVLVADPNAKPTEEQRRQGAITLPAEFGFAAGIGMEWRFVRKKVQPFHASVVLRKGDEILWTDNQMIREGQRLYPRPKESVEDLMQRVAKPNPQLIREISLPGRMCRPGTATAAGAFGASLLDAEGVVADYTGE